MRLQHPESLVVDTETLDEEVFGLGIASFPGNSSAVFRICDQGLVVFDKVSDIVLSRKTAFHAADLAHSGKHIETTRGIGLEGAQVLGDVVDRGEEFFVLSLEGDVQLEKVWSFHIPVREVGLSHQGIAVGKESLQRGDDLGVGIGVCSSGHAHGFEDALYWQVCKEHSRQNIIFFV